jgi:hypothetical protein
MAWTRGPHAHTRLKSGLADFISEWCWAWLAGKSFDICGNAT